MTVASVGDRVRTGRYTVHSRFRRVVNYACGPDMVFVAEESVGAGPLTILIRKMDVEAADCLDVFEGGMAMGGHAYSFKGAPRFSSIVEPASHAPVCLRRNLDDCRRLLRAEAPPSSMVFALGEHPRRTAPAGFEEALHAQLAAGAALLRKGLEQARAGRPPDELAKSIHTLKGCGRGLTPSGDDFLAGSLSALHLVRWALNRNMNRLIQRMAKAAESRNALSNAFIRMAAEGRLFEPMKDLAQALLHEDGTRLQQTIRRVLRQGETSGADWTAGFLMTLDVFAYEGSR